MPLTRDQIFAHRASLPTEEVEVPELNGSVRIRLLSLAEVGEVLRVQKNATDASRFYQIMVEKSCVNDDGTPMFVGEDVKEISKLPWAVLDTIVKASVKLSRLRDDESPPKD